MNQRHSVGPEGSGTLSFSALFWIAAFIIVIYLLSQKFTRNDPGSDRAADLLHHRGRYSRLGQEERTLNLNTILADDPLFSKTVLLDFASALFATFQKSRARHGAGMTLLTGYFEPESIQTYQALSSAIQSVDGVLISGIRIVSLSDAGEFWQMAIDFDSNYTETNDAGHSQSWYSQDRWTLRRKKGVKSKIPEKARLIQCPSCGSTPQFSNEGVCGSCGQTIRNGNFDWVVTHADPIRKAMPPLLTETVEETGTDEPTRFAPTLSEDRLSFMAKNPGFNWNLFLGRASEAFVTLQKAWTEQKWELIRPFESENIFQTHLFWIEEFKKQQLVNVLKDVKLSHLEPVKIESDAFYESITVRIHAAMVDYTISARDQHLICGNPHSSRAFTEYWTFIRTHEASQKDKKETGCPACGAPLKINQSGRCEYCTALVTSGAFDWVLSLIEQDETYQG